MIFAIRREGNNPTLRKARRCASYRSCVQTPAFRFAFAFADANAINRLPQFDQIITVGSTERAVERMAMASLTRGRFSPLIRCFPAYPTSFFAPFSISRPGIMRTILEIQPPSTISFFPQLGHHALPDPTPLVLQHPPVTRLGGGTNIVRHIFPTTPGGQDIQDPIPTSRSSARGRPVRAGRGMSRWR